eukprot:6465611-Amphidinium_carterae.1
MRLVEERKSTSVGSACMKDGLNISKGFSVMLASEHHTSSQTPKHSVKFTARKKSPLMARRCTLSQQVYPMMLLFTFQKTLNNQQVENNNDGGLSSKHVNNLSCAW